MQPKLCTKCKKNIAVVFIAKMENGVTMTYRELIEHTLLYSDNIAFAELRKVFGNTPYYTTARALGVRGSSYGFMQTITYWNWTRIISMP